MPCLRPDVYNPFERLKRFAVPGGASAISTYHASNVRPGFPGAVLSMRALRLVVKIDGHALSPFVAVIISIAVIPGIAGVAPAVVIAGTVGVRPFPVAIRVLMTMFPVPYLLDIASLHMFGFWHEDRRGV
jgi:hypothetical protein